MMVCALVAVLILGHVLPGLDGGETVTCHGRMFYDCFHYCNSGCREVARDQCLARCDYGCGCKKGFIIENNGGCKELHICKKKEQHMGEIESEKKAEQGSIEGITPVIEDDQSSNGKWKTDTDDPGPNESGQDKPDPAEPSPAEPDPAEPAPYEPAPDEPAPAEPGPDEPGPDEPGPLEPLERTGRKNAKWIPIRKY